jgi:transposase
VRQAEIDDGLSGGVTSDDVAEVQRLEQENLDLKRANDILGRVASFFGAELDRQHR